jgi:FAD:protein FMN transferase
MKSSSIALLSFTITMLLGIFLLIPKFEKEYKKAEGFIQGTTYHITYEYKKKDDLKPDIEKILHDFDMSLSSYVPNSIISRINRNDSTVEADDWFIEVFKKSEELNRITDGAFDITVGPIINAMGFGPTAGKDIDSSMIESLRQFVGMQKVRLAGRKVVKQNTSVFLDVNALAQGYSVDVVSRFLDSKNIRNYLVEIGGELRARGVNAKSEDWHVGIDRPAEGNMEEGQSIQAILKIKTKSVATSGNYRKFHVVKGIKYAHIINPKTGYPALSNLLSTTVVADDCITADGYATALMVLGLEKSIKFLSVHKELAAMLIYSDENGNYEIYTTDNMKYQIVQEIQ